MEDREKRRYQSHLRMGAIGVVAFGVWGIIKGFITTLTADGGLASMIPEDENPEEMMKAVVIMLIVMIAISLFMRLTIGFCARAESKGVKLRHRNFYIVLIVIELLISVGSIVLDVADLVTATEGVLNILFLLVMEISNGYALLEVITSVIKLRKMEKAEAEK